MNKGAQIFYRWRLDKEMRQRDVGVLLDQDHAHISKIELGKRLPGRSLAVLIEKVTNGAVCCGMWDEDPLPEHVVNPSMNPEFDIFLDANAKKKRKRG